MIRKVFNFQTGETQTVKLTPEEIAADEARAATHAAANVPKSVGRAQAKIWLHRAGKLAAVQAYIDQADDPELTLWWNEATSFEITNSYIVALAAGFNIDLPTAFTQAAAIG